MNYSNNISVFGASGFIGFNFCKLYKNINIIKKESNIPTSSEVLYFISTVDNYNIHTDPYGAWSFTVFLKLSLFYF